MIPLSASLTEIARFYLASQSEPHASDDPDVSTLARVLAFHGKDLIDYRSEPKPKRGRAVRERPLEQVSALWLHQTAAVWHEPRRCLGVPAHACVMPNGAIVLLHDPTDYLYHGHAANRFSVGIEIVCRAAGLVGDPRSFWRSKRERLRGASYSDLVCEANERQIASARMLIHYYRKILPALAFVGAHRQSHKSRRSDPGQRIWAEVGDWCVQDLELLEAPVVGSGRPIPNEWKFAFTRERY